MSLITEALELQAKKKPRAIQVEALPPFSSGSPRRLLKPLIWTAGLALAVTAGVWQGPAAWKWVEEAVGILGPRAATAPKAAAPAASALQETSAPLPPAPVQGEAAPSVPAAPEVPLPLVVPFQATDMDEIAAAAQKLKEQREQAVRNFQIQGVRMQGKESRALIDGNPVSLGELVGAEGLKLKAIEPSRILFEDSNGAEYIKSY